MSNPYAPPDPSRPRPPAPPVLPVRPVAGPGPTPVTPPPPPDPAALAHASRLLRTTLLLLLASLAVALLPAPWGLASVVFTSVALVTGLRAALAASRARAGRLLVVPAMLLTVTAGVGLLLAGASAYLLPAQLSYARCQQSAVTEQAARACTSAYRTDVTQLQRRLSSRR